MSDAHTDLLVVSGASSEATLRADGASPSDELRDLERGSALGRYVVLGRLGAGGMGVVYAGYDPELDRKVALKLLHAPERGAEGRARQLREAQALARLSHPNIVTVHDVGTHGDRVWIAMELVAGKTLTLWSSDAPHKWADAVAVMMSAGRGLAAAHDSGLVHRDFKPDNVMVGVDGRVRVMDFGLARSVEGETPSEPSLAPHDDDIAPRLPTLHEALTRAGAIAGTPAYMAPEQFAAGTVDARTDQFSFCVATWEALFGRRPFRGSSPAELATAVLGGEMQPPPPGSRVPKWLRRCLLRGLAPSRGDRWPTMEALLEALARGHGRARARTVLVSLGALALVAAAGLGVYRLDVRARMAACEREGASIAEVWNDDARARVSDAMLATGLGYARTTTERVTPWLDAQAQAWQHARSRACLDENVHGAWNADMLDRSLWCLDERRMELEALVDELSRADAAGVRGAVTAAAALSRVDVCLDAELLERLPAPPSERREDVRAVRAELSRARALQHAGKYGAGLEVVSSVRALAESLQWPPLSATAHLTEASLLESGGELERAERLGAQAYFEAARVDAWDVAAAAASELAYVVGYQHARYRDGLTWDGHAQVALAHVGDPDSLREARRLNNLGAVHMAAREHETARAAHERALAIWQATLEPDHPLLAAGFNNLGLALAALGEPARARESYDRGLALWEEALGSDHPLVAEALANLAGLDFDSGDYDQARARLERAREILENALGPEHPDVAQCLNNLAGAYYAGGHEQRARPLFDRALAIWEKALGPQHPAVATALYNLAGITDIRSEAERARALYERALAIRETVFGPEHPDVANTLGHLADMHLASGAPKLALPLAERSVAIFEAHDGRAEHEAFARFALARALVATRGDRARARALAENARVTLRAAASPDPGQVALVDAWLAEHQ